VPWLKLKLESIFKLSICDGPAGVILYIMATRLALLCLLALGLCSAPASARLRRAAPAPAACRAGPPVDENQPGATPRFRLTPTAVCAYDLAGLYRRLMPLFTAPPTAWSVDYVERLFGMPPMRSSYDDTRIADYAAILRGAGGWELRIWVRDAYYPLDARPPRFVPGPRPRRLARRDDATVMIDLFLSEPRGTVPGAGGCLSVAAALAGAFRAGWRDRSNEIVILDGPAPRYPAFGRGRRSFQLTFPMAGLSSTQAELEATCAADMSFTQEPRGR
jgi:hypothetical protein